MIAALFSTLFSVLASPLVVSATAPEAAPPPRHIAYGTDFLQTDRGTAFPYTLITNDAPPSSPNPCARRQFCGAIKLVPRDPSERRAFYVTLISSLADGIVTAEGMRPYAFHDAVTGTPISSSTGWGESDPFEAPFAGSGQVTPIIAGGLFYRVVASSLERRWTSEDRTRADYDETVAHVYGISSWVPNFSQRNRWNNESAACSTILANTGVRGANGVFVPPTGSGPKSVTAALPAYCQGFTTTPIQSSAATH
ncbi:MAG TPA: hypothetical protein VGZ00_05815 [Candidatus Baltobacteraceae bacterium]|jgi:hypothetical protein|nr:hypothetical protein [Candidatus Baltobacteraceae bacterium]